MSYRITLINPSGILNLQHAFDYSPFPRGAGGEYLDIVQL
jgi:hypothetical protein